MRWHQDHDISAATRHRDEVIRRQRILGRWCAPAPVTDIGIGEDASSLGLVLPTVASLLARSTLRRVDTAPGLKLA